MIKTIIGDLIELSKKDTFDVIAHSANCFHKMVSGIAKEIKLTYPEAFEADSKTQFGDVNKLGTISYTDSINPLVVNIYAQYKYDRFHPVIQYDMLVNGLNFLKKIAYEKFEKPRLGIPLIGCGLAGGTPINLLRVIQKVFTKEDDLTIVIYNNDNSIDKDDILLMFNSILK